MVGTIPGTELPDEYVLLSAHLDSWDGASGATDNGTGTVMMLEAMRILRAAYPNPRRTIMVGHWGGEEQGLIGSTAFAADNPEVIDGLQAAFNQDNGTWRIDYIRMQGFTGAGTHFGRWFSKIPVEITGHIELDIPGVPETGGSDHMSFICKPAPGIPSPVELPGLSAIHMAYQPGTRSIRLFLQTSAITRRLPRCLHTRRRRTRSEYPQTQGFLPADPRTGRPGQWPQCRPPRRSPGGEL